MHQLNKIALLIPILLSSISGWATDNLHRLPSAIGYRAHAGTLERTPYIP